MGKADKRKRREEDSEEVSLKEEKKKKKKEKKSKKRSIELEDAEEDAADGVRVSALSTQLVWYYSHYSAGIPKILQIYLSPCVVVIINHPPTVQSENCARTTSQSSKFLCAVEREKRAREKNPDRAVGSLGHLGYLTKRRCAR